MLPINMPSPCPSPRSNYTASLLSFYFLFEGRDSEESLMAFEDTEGLLGVSNRKGRKLLEKNF